MVLVNWFDLLCPIILEGCWFIVVRVAAVNRLVLTLHFFLSKWFQCGHIVLRCVDRLNMEELNIPSYCIYHMTMGFGIAAGLHLIAVVFAQFKAFLWDALRGR